MRALVRALCTVVPAIAPLAGCAHSATTETAATAASEATPVPQAAATRAVNAAAPLEATTAPTAVPTPAPTLPPAPHFSAPPAATASSAGGPQILSVATTPNVVHSGESVSWNVRTTLDVVSVTAHVSAYTIPLQPQGPGHFYLAFTIPSTVPAVFHGTYDLELTAKNQAGASSKRSVPMVFQ